MPCSAWSKKNEPVIVSLSHTRTWYVFTDGAFEPGSETPATIGGMLLNQDGRCVEHFGVALPVSLFDQFLSDSKHPIYELELLPVLVAIRVWSQFLLRAHVVFYLDNNAAHSALVRADGATTVASGLVSEFVRMEKLLKILPWFARVPSHSNPSDSASRLEFNVPWLKGSRFVAPTLLSRKSVRGKNERACVREAVFRVVHVCKFFYHDVDSICE